MSNKLHAIALTFSQIAKRLDNIDSTYKSAVDKHIADEKKEQATLFKAFQSALVAAVESNSIPLLHISNMLPDLTDARRIALTNARGEQGNFRDLFIQNSNKIWVVKRKSALTTEEKQALVNALANPFEAEKPKRAEKTEWQKAESALNAASKIADKFSNSFSVQSLTALEAVIAKMQAELAQAKAQDAVAGEYIGPATEVAQQAI